MVGKFSERGGQEATALQALATLKVKGRAPMTGYDRDQFGPGWVVANRQRLRHRDDILRRDLTSTLDAGSGRRLWTSGRVFDNRKSAIEPVIAGEFVLVATPNGLLAYHVRRQPRAAPGKQAP